MSPTYSEYLRLEELLKLQTGVEGETRNISNDELHFILVHQNFELWFKLVINELTCTRNILSSDYVEETKLPQAVHHMERVIETFKLMSQQWRKSDQDIIFSWEGISTPSMTITFSTFSSLSNILCNL